MSHSALHVDENSRLVPLDDDVNSNGVRQSQATKRPKKKRGPLFLRSFSNNIFPSSYDADTTIVRTERRKNRSHSTKEPRSLRRRIFLVLTEPETSISSALFFALLIVAISLMNIVMIMQTMDHWQFTPSDCRSCGGPKSYVFDDDDSIVESPSGVTCVCPPAPLKWTVVVLNFLVYFFTVEWFVRVLTFDPPCCERATSYWGLAVQWFEFLTCYTTILDALAIFPYYIESMSNGLLSLRLLRLFRVFQLVRLGQYNETFMSLTAVLAKSFSYLKLLLGVLLFGAAFFGSMIYYAEKGDWKFYEKTQSHHFIRLDANGFEEISPFTSIPSAFWWFAVTATTVGYGDACPTSTLGKFIATVAMLLGVLVIAFPVSVFSDLWSKELRNTGFHLSVDSDSEDECDSPGTFDGPRDIQMKREPSGLDGAVYLQRNNFSSLGTMRNMSEIEDDDCIRMHKDDLLALTSQLGAMHESQRQIRSILRKYNLH